MADSPYDAVASAITAIFNAEFAAEQYTMDRDDLHESLGRDRVYAGIAPMEDRVSPRNSVVNECLVEVKFYDIWPQGITPETAPKIQVDPTKVTVLAQRFRDALRRQNATDPGTGMVWYFDVLRVYYPRDPAGKRTRFVAEIRAFGNNPNLVETTG